MADIIESYTCSIVASSDYFANQANPTIVFCVNIPNDFIRVGYQLSYDVKNNFVIDYIKKISKTIYEFTLSYDKLLEESYPAIEVGYKQGEVIMIISLIESDNPENMFPYWVT